MNLLVGIRHFLNRNKWVIILIAVIIGTVCSMLVDFTNPDENAHWYNALWHTFQIFTIGASFPHDGPWYAYYPLIVLYFFIPIVTLSFINDMFNSFLNLPKKKYDNLTDHVVIAGLGKTGDFLSRQFAQNTRSRNINVLVIDNDTELIKKNTFLNSNIKYLLEDISKTGENTFIERANIKKAKLFITLTGNDFANLDAAFLLKKEKEKPYCFIQISDIHLLHAIREDPSKYFSSKENKIHIINSYEIVATKVVREILSRKNEKIKDKEVHFVIAGFGNFGKMIYEQIIIQQSNNKSDNYSICVVDTDSDINDEIFSTSITLNEIDSKNKKMPISADSPQYLNSDIRKMGTWEGVFNENKNKFIVVIIATDNDTNNLIAALRIQKVMEIRQQEINLVCRFFRNPLILLEMPNVTACTFSDIFHAELNQMINKAIKS